MVNSPRLVGECNRLLRSPEWHRGNDGPKDLLLHHRRRGLHVGDEGWWVVQPRVWDCGTLLVDFVPLIAGGLDIPAAAQIATRSREIEYLAAAALATRHSRSQNQETYFWIVLS
jgi:hypothetical protein